MRTAILFSTLIYGASAQVVSPPAMPHGSGSSYVGVMMQEIDSQRAKSLKLPEEAGVEITRVEPDSPAERAGLKPGDAIVQYNGERVEGIEQFSRLVRETPVGREVKMEIIREGTPQTIVVKVGARRFSPVQQLPLPLIPPGSPLEVRMPDIPRSFMTWRSSALGIECEGLEGQLADYFGVNHGVLVRSVSKNSAAEHAGVKAGDVITRVDDSKVATPADLSSHIRSSHGKTVALTVMRDHKEVSLSVSIEDDGHMDR
jgi:serine protease Do